MPWTFRVELAFNVPGCEHGGDVARTLRAIARELEAGRAMHGEIAARVKVGDELEERPIGTWGLEGERARRGVPPARARCS